MNINEILQYCNYNGNSPLISKDDASSFARTYPSTALRTDIQYMLAPDDLLYCITEAPSEAVNLVFLEDFARAAPGFNRELKHWCEERAAGSRMKWDKEYYIQKLS